VSQQYDVAKIINEKGCVQAGEEWMERNLLIVAGFAVATAFLQVCMNEYTVNVVSIQISVLKKNVNFP
jgi:hypothetical protein